jgi:hypothetical protein
MPGKSKKTNLAIGLKEPFIPGWQELGAYSKKSKNPPKKHKQL